MLAMTAAEVISLVSGIGALLAIVAKFAKDWWEARKERATLEQASATGAKSIAITELEKALPGLGEIIERYRQDAEYKDTRIRELEERMEQQREHFDAELAADRLKCEQRIVEVSQQCDQKIRLIRDELLVARQRIRALEDGHHG